MLGTERFGQCSDYQAVPGFGLQCKISGIENLLSDKEKSVADDIIPSSTNGTGLMEKLSTTFVKWVHDKVLILLVVTLS